MTIEQARAMLKERAENYSMSVSIAARLLCVRCAGLGEWAQIPDFDADSNAYFHKYGDRGVTAIRCEASILYSHVERHWPR